MSKQKDIMTQLAERLAERDETILTLETLNEERGEQIQFLQDAVDRRWDNVLRLQKIVMEGLIDREDMEEELMRHGVQSMVLRVDPFQAKQIVEECTNNAEGMIGGRNGEEGEEDTLTDDIGSVDGFSETGSSISAMSNVYSSIHNC
eukprot:TRINITY_DN8649_c0_g1_i1.p2 TRINITY_DN8649_c0_g1~~TRINITY_DN8649_c0_g1_i1.p2  ORF type:complete len:147 (+),score=61.44 TRINITY_DN8649_c0_g1_i1:120-560(+)